VVEECEARTVVYGVADLAEVRANGGSLSGAHSGNVDFEHVIASVAPASNTGATKRVYYEREIGESPVERAKRPRSAKRDLVAGDVVWMPGAAVAIERHEHVGIHRREQRDQLGGRGVDVVCEGVRTPLLPVDAAVNKAALMPEEEVICDAQCCAGTAQLFLSQGSQWNVVRQSCADHGIVRPAELAARRRDDDRHRASLGNARDRSTREQALVIGVRK
jgi:hypothetical protein